MIHVTWSFESLDTAWRRKSRFFYGDRKINEKPAVSQFCPANPPANATELDTRFKSGQTHSIEKSRGDHTIHNHPLAALKSGDRCPSLWPNDSINYALIVAELTQATLHSCNRRIVVNVVRTVVRVTVGITAVV